MEGFMNLAKKGYEAYEESGDSNRDERRGNDNEDNQYQETRHHESYNPEFDHEDVVNRAQQHSGNSEDSGFFSSAMSHVMNRKGESHEPVDEEHVTRAHHEAYSNGNAGNLDSGSMGAAAAMQAMKMFTASGGEGGNNQLISLAMGEASKLFDSSGGSSSGGKQDAINSAAMTMMKMVVMSKFSGGGNSGGGMGSLLGMASKFI